MKSLEFWHSYKVSTELPPSLWNSKILAGANSKKIKNDHYLLQYRVSISFSGASFLLLPVLEL